jgi:hypothetical protein
MAVVMKGDRQLLAKLFYAKGWTWWRIRRGYGKKSGYGIRIGKRKIFVPISRLERFVKDNLPAANKGG